MIRLKKILLFLFFVQSVNLSPVFSEKYDMEVNIPWTGLMRIKALESLDRMLSLAFDQKNRSYQLMHPLREEYFKNSFNELMDFANLFGFFSSKRVLIGTVTDEKEDVELTCTILKSLESQNISTLEKSIITGEVLTKILAYRNLKQGMEIPIPVIVRKGKSKLMVYVVDHIFDLWGGMPAFGLVPKEPGTAAPILLFRGTDLSLGTTRSWASVISDLNTSGPGLSTFRNAQGKIHGWLASVANDGIKARAMGYSLGGVLTAYTIIFEHELLVQDKHQPSMSFNAPGVSRSIKKLWDAIPEKEKIPFSAFVNRGDLVSKIGLLLGDVFEFSLNHFLKPISAHVTLISGEPVYRFYKVNVELENLSRQ